MGIELTLEQAQRLLHEIGINLSTRQFGGLLVVSLLIILIAVLRFLAGVVKGILRQAGNALAFLRQDQETRDYIQLRNRFANHCMIEIQRLNQETDWNDFYYTTLEAEVEVEQVVGFGEIRGRFFIAWLRSLPSLIRIVLGKSRTTKKAKSLVDAIQKSRYPTFLVIGEPGSGKTVSLRHLALRLAKECSESNKRSTPVPLYLNLKSLNLPPEMVTAESIHTWVLAQLEQGQDRLVHVFLEKHFNRMLQEGSLFFMFDSFDEIPAVLDAYEDTEIVKKYALALSRFLQGPHASRGLVTSRPYRAPKVFVGQRMTIRPLGRQRIRYALKKYLVGQGPLAGLLWHELLRSRDDLLSIAGNPFYLGLLARYAEERHGLPDRQFDLFEHFIQRRLQADSDRLLSFGLTPADALDKASQLAYVMTQTPTVGLDAQIPELISVFCREAETLALGPSSVKQLLDALTYSKLARQAPGTSTAPAEFSFAHRRFHEYFCARFLRDRPSIMSISSQIGDNRWREVMVLLCETLPVEGLTEMLRSVEASLDNGLTALSGSAEHFRAIDSLRLLRVGFRSRIRDLPNSIRQLCTAFINRQFDEGNELDRKRALEAVIVADEQAAPILLERALASNSAWLRETAIQSCRVLSAPSDAISQGFRAHLFEKYGDFSLFRNMGYYGTILSSPATFLPIRSFMVILVVSGVLQLLMYSIVMVYSAAILKLGVLVLLIFWVAIASFYFLFGTRLSQPMRETKMEDRVPYKSDQYLRWLLSRAKRQTNRAKTHTASRTADRTSFPVTWSVWHSLALALIALVLAATLLARFSQPALSPYAFLRPLVAEQSWMIATVPISCFALFLNTLLVVLITDYPSTLTFPGLVKIFKQQGKSIISKMSVARFIAGAWILWSGIAIVQSDFSLVSLQQQYPPLMAWIALIPVLVSLLVASILMLLTIPFYLLLTIELPARGTRLLSIMRSVVRDQSRLISMSIQPRQRPHTAEEAITVLDAYATDYLKTQYVSLLGRWLPFCDEWQLLLKAAESQQGSVREGLLILAETWQDSALRT